MKSVPSSGVVVRAGLIEALCHVEIIGLKITLIFRNSGKTKPGKTKMIFLSCPLSFIFLDPFSASPPTWAVVLSPDFGRSNREAAFSINISFCPCQAGLSWLSLPYRDFPTQWMRCSCGVYRQGMKTSLSLSHFH